MVWQQQEDRCQHWYTIEVIGGPQMLEVEYRWSGQVMEPVDGLAFIGRNPLDQDNVYIATGDSGQRGRTRLPGTGRMAIFQLRSRFHAKAQRKASGKRGAFLCAFASGLCAFA
jgi:glycine/D-amino acid oxidase-like deaminating enzyme